MFIRQANIVAQQNGHFREYNVILCKEIMPHDL